jgi:sugar/nucleoside kinase (ribokinase family)
MIRPPDVSTTTPSTSLAVPALVVVGDLMLDIVIAPERAIERGSDVPGRLSFRRGGSAANTASAFVRLGGRATLLTCVGDDPLGRRLVRALRSEGVRVHALYDPAPSGRVAALVDASGERSFVTQRGAADHLARVHVRPAWLRGCRAVHVPGYSIFRRPLAEATVAAVAVARHQGALVSVDLSSSGPLRALGRAEVERRLAAIGPDVLFANRQEAAALLGSRVDSALLRLLRLAPVAVVKEGLAGCRLLWRDGAAAGANLSIAPAGRVLTSDSSGAGDAFAAGFLYAWLARSAMVDAVALRRAAMAGHRAAAAALRADRPELPIG